MDKVRLDPDLVPLAEFIGNPALPSITSSPPSVMRAMLSQLAPAHGPDVPAVSDGAIAGIQVRDYRPAGSQKATILFFHGGGWVVGSIADYDSFARTLACATQCRVVSVEYRLAPEYPFPAAIEDAEAVLFAIEADGPLFVCGDSAGGNIAAVMAQIARDGGKRPLAGQILMYPSVAGDADSPAMQAFEPPFMDRAAIGAFYDMYVPNRTMRTDPRFAPLRGKMHDLAPALVITAGADLLAAEGTDYASALAAAGCDVVLHCEPGAMHAFLTLAPEAAATRRSLDRIAHFIDRQIASI